MNNVETEDNHTVVGYLFSFGFLSLREWAAVTCTDCLAFRKCSSHPGFYISHGDSYLSLTPEARTNFN